MSDNALFKRPDTYRQTLEAEQMKFARVFDSFCIEASQKVNTFLTEKCNCTGSKVVKFAHKLTMDDSSNTIINGEIDFTVEALYDGETKTIEVPVKVTENKTELPENKVLVSQLDSAKSARAVEALKIKQEIESNIQKINENETFKKEAFEQTLNGTGMQKVASSVSAPANMLSETLKINKDFLPAGVGVGDVLYIDAAKYRIVSGDDDKLNVEGSGVYWTLSKVLDILDKDEKVINVQDKF